MEEEIKELKNERKVEKREIRQNNTKKKGLVAGVLAGGSVALALGLGLGLGLKGTPIYEVQLESNMQDDTLTGDGEFKKGSIVTIEAEPIDGYTFTHWNFNGTLITANPYIFELTEDTQGIYEAVYETAKLDVSVFVDNIKTLKVVEYNTTLNEILQIDFTEITDENSCGWYYDKELTKPIDVNAGIIDDMSIYTKKATLDKITISQLYLDTTLAEEEQDKNYYVQAKDETITGEVVLPKTYLDNKVTGLAEGAFMNTGITTMTIPETITKIKDDIFYNCKSLENVYFAKNEKLTKISHSMFYGSTIKEIVIPSTVQSIKNYAFNECEQLEKVTFQENSIIESIGSHGFYGCSSVKSINLPNTVTTLGKNAFELCSSMTDFIVEDNSQLIEIPAVCFRDCTSLQNFSLGENSIIKSINNGAFQRAGAFTIVIPKTVTEIMYDCFRESGLCGIEFEEGSMLETIGKSAFYNAGVFDIVIPKSVTRMEENTFRSSGIKTISFEEDSALSVIYFEGTFCNCDYLTSVDLSNLNNLNFDSGSWIDSDVFRNCDNLKELIFPENIDVTKKILEETSEFLVGIQGLESIEIPEGITILGFSLLKNCINLKEVVLPSTLELIEEAAFRNCVSLEKIVIPENVTEINTDAFRYCTNLTEVEILSKDIYLSDEVFGNCVNLEKVTISENANVTLGVQVFRNCDKLTNINFTSNYIVENGVLFNSDKTELICYLGGNTIKNYTIPDTVEKIAKGAFDGTKIEQITIPNSVKVIEEYAFHNCFKLKSVNFESGCQVTSLEACTFEGCSDLNSFTVPASVTNISTSTFGDEYSSNTTWKLYNRLSEILVENGNATFTSDGKNLIKVVDSSTALICGIVKSASETQKIVGDYLFEEVKNDQSISYRLIAYLGKENEIILPSVQVVGGNYSIGQSYKSIFGNKIEKVTFSEGIYSISQSAFRECINLKEIYISSTITTIGNSAFENCINLVNVNFAENSQLKSIGSNAFKGCYNLKSFKVTSNVETISEDAFAALPDWCELKATFINELIIESVDIYNYNLGGDGGYELYLDSFYDYIENDIKKVYVLKDIVDDENNYNNALSNTMRFSKTKDTVTLDGQEYYVYTRI